MSENPLSLRLTNPRPRSGRRQAQKATTRRRLIDAACEQFARFGVAATTTAHVARAAAVAHGTVFVHFPTRADLVASVIEARAGAIAERLESLVAAGAEVPDVLAAHLEGLAEHEAFYARLVTEAPALPAEARNALLGIQSVISHHLCEAAQRGMDAGHIRPMALHMLFNTWIGLVDHYVAHRDLFAPGGSVLRERGPELLDHFVGLVSTDRA